MKSCIVIYDRVNLLSFAKIYDVLVRSKIDFEVVALRSDVCDEKGLRLNPTRHSESLYGYNMVIVPDGTGALNLRYDDIFLSWIRSAGGTNLLVGLDLGVLILGGAGFLEGKSAVVRGGYKNALSEFCMVEQGEFVKDKNVISMVDSAFAWNEFVKLING